MARISFRGKIETVYNVDESIAWRFVKVPELARRHCDMNAMRRHPKFGGLANSDLFPNLLKRIKADKLGETVRLDRIPNGVTVDTSGFLAVVSLDV